MAARSSSRVPRVLAPRRAERVPRGVRANAIALFGLFAVTFLMACAHFTARLFGVHYTGTLFVVWGVWSLLGAFYAAVYLGLWWWWVAKLPRAYAAMGLVGGLGLFAVLGLLALAAYLL